MLGEVISLQDSHKSFSCEQDAVRPQSKLVVSGEGEMEEGRVWGGRGTAGREAALH